MKSKAMNSQVSRSVLKYIPNKELGPSDYLIMRFQDGLRHGLAMRSLMYTLHRD